MDPRVLLLGIGDSVAQSTHKLLFVFYTGFYAKKTILLKWRQPDPPAITHRRSLIYSVLLEAHLHGPVEFRIPGNVVVFSHG